MTWPAATDAVMAACIDSFGESITYTPDGCPPVFIRAIIDMEFQQIDPNTGAIVSSNQPMIGVRDSDLEATPAPGDTCIVRGLEYKIIERQEDGHAGSRLLLHRL